MFDLAVGSLTGDSRRDLVVSGQETNSDVDVFPVAADGRLGSPVRVDPTTPGTFQNPNAGRVRVVDLER